MNVLLIDNFDSFSFNLVDDAIESGGLRSAWGSATAGLDVTVLESGFDFGDSEADENPPHRTLYISHSRTCDGMRMCM